MQVRTTALLTVTPKHPHGGHNFMSPTPRILLIRNNNKSKVFSMVVVSSNNSKQEQQRKWQCPTYFRPLQQGSSWRQRLLAREGGCFWDTKSRKYDRLLETYD